MVSKFCDPQVDLHPDKVSNLEMGYLYEELVRRFSELSNETADNIEFGNSFSEDAFDGERYDYLLANPPFGVEWKKVADVVRTEHHRDGFGARFGAGLPHINDGSFSFLQHMISKMRRLRRAHPARDRVQRFAGAAGSDESEIRRWIIENDWLEAVVALPDQLFYNTGISTYFWIVTNRKSAQRRGKVQLIDARAGAVELRVARTRATQRLGVLHQGPLPQALTGLAETGPPAQGRVGDISSLILAVVSVSGTAMARSDPGGWMPGGWIGHRRRPVWSRRAVRRVVVADEVSPLLVSACCLAVDFR